LDDNPFFDSYYLKTPTTGDGDTLFKNRYFEKFDAFNEIKAKTRFDDFYIYTTRETARRTANEILKILPSLKTSGRYKDAFNRTYKVDFNDFEYIKGV